MGTKKKTTAKKVTAPVIETPVTETPVTPVTTPTDKGKLVPFTEVNKIFVSEDENALSIVRKSFKDVSTVFINQVLGGVDKLHGELVKLSFVPDNKNEPYIGIKDIENFFDKGHTMDCFSNCPDNARNSILDAIIDLRHHLVTL